MARELDPRNAEWKRMLQLRTCPPLDDLQKGGPEVELHLRSCPECRERLEEAADLQAFDKAFMKDMPPRQACPAPAAGQVWQLLRSAVPGGIRNSHGWHNPPMVIVLPDETGVPGMLRVAQIHDAGELAGPGDYMLTGMFSDCFAESWNTWPAFSDSMAYVGECSPQIAAMVSEAAKKGCATPGGDCLPNCAAAAMEPEAEIPCVMPEEESVEFYFRRQELNIGAFYGKSAVARGLALLDAAGDAKETPRQLQKASVIPFREWPPARKAHFASLAYDGPMAAAAAPLAATGAAGAFSGKQRPARVKLVTNGATGSFRWIEATMSFSARGDTVFVLVSGTLPEDAANGRIDDAYSVAASGAEARLNTAELSGGRAFTVDFSFPRESWKEGNPGTVIFVSTGKGA